MLIQTRFFFTISICLLFIAFVDNALYAQLLDSLALSQKKEYRNLKEALETPEDVYRLSLKKKKLAKFPAEILRLYNLNELNLSNNKIVKIPPEISSLTYLQYLNLSNNQLTNIPAEIGTLKNLSALILNRNNIQQLPPEIGELYSLKLLDIWGTEINDLPYEISKLKHTLLKIDMRVIYMNRKQQDEILKWFPNTEVLFSKPCNCN